MRSIAAFMITLLTVSCTSSPYTWQDTRQPPREDATVDLEKCRTYSARQYRPGVPMGAPYLKELASTTEEVAEHGHGEWRPDRSPFHTTNINTLPVHKIPVEYTGYPGELDYYPDYLDEILEKCMHDLGWSYQPALTDE